MAPSIPTASAAALATVLLILLISGSVASRETRHGWAPRRRFSSSGLEGSSTSSSSELLLSSVPRLLSCCGGGGGIWGSSSLSSSSSPSSSSERCGGLCNSALVFVKPHADTPAVRSYVRSALIDKIPGVKIVEEYEISGRDIDRKKMIDRHYFAIASRATILKPEKINVPVETFRKFFGEEWGTVLKEGRAANAVQACRRFGCDEKALDDMWREAEEDGKVVKLGGGFYCGLLSPPPLPSSTSSSFSAPLYVFNAFFMSMRSKYVQPRDCSVYCYEIEWDPNKLPWKKFRANVLGPTDPAKAPRGSIRRTIRDRYVDFGLERPPDKGDNSVHGSASPFEGLVEKANWGKKKFVKDDFGTALLFEKGVPFDEVVRWSSDPRVTLPDGRGEGSLFDAVEDLDAEECLDRLVKIADAGH